MHCPYCGHKDTQVIDSRAAVDQVKRKRRCANPSCGARFATVERLERSTLRVVKKDGRREAFDRAKLLRGLYRACEKRPIADDAIEALASEIEAAAWRLGVSEVASAALGDLVMERLRDLDEIAYIRFASVYRAFRDLETLRDELESLQQRQARRRQVNGQPPLFSPNEWEALERPTRPGHDSGGNDEHPPPANQ